MGRTASLTAPKIGDIFGHWVVLKPEVRHSRWRAALCRCKCGTEKVIRISRLLNGTSKSCGCQRWEGRAIMVTYGQREQTLSKACIEIDVRHSTVMIRAHKTGESYQDAFDYYASRRKVAA